MPTNFQGHMEVVVAGARFIAFLKLTFKDSVAGSVHIIYPLSGPLVVKTARRLWRN